MDDPEFEQSFGQDEAGESREASDVERIRRAVARGLKDVAEDRVVNADQAFDELEARFRGMARRA